MSVDREQKWWWSLCRGRAKSELSMVMEILHLLIFLEQRGMKHLHARVSTQVGWFCDSAERVEETCREESLSSVYCRGATLPELWSGEH